MTKKTITISARPSGKLVGLAADAWVENRAEAGSEEKMKRLTLDIPESMHRRIKAQCALNGNTIVEEIREILLQKYGKT